ncbi:hypothetical protein [Buttiauxella gaviniae]|uniref:hypothetical protein n=1 Tax=Buttiauxella gaviniae TaxID=82990 RepID=UPI0039B09D5A
MEFYHYILIFIGCMLVLKMIINSCQSQSPATTKILVCRNDEMVELDAIVINRNTIKPYIESDEQSDKESLFKSNFPKDIYGFDLGSEQYDLAHPMYHIVNESPKNFLDNDEF